MGRYPPSLAVAIETEAAFHAAMLVVSERYLRHGRQPGERAEGCHAACLAGRAGYGRDDALLGLSWCICGQIRTHLVGGLPKPSLQQESECWGSPALGTDPLGEWRGAGFGGAQVEGPRRNPVWE